jgi:hypothetical protein
MRHGDCFLSRMLRTICVALLVALARSAAGGPVLWPGTYRLDTQLAMQADVPVFGKSRSTWQSVALVTIRATGSRLVQRHQTCGAHIDAGFPGVRMRVPHAFTAALPVPSYPIDVRGGHYRADFGIQYVGYRPRGATAPVPHAAGDPSVVDWDHDGRPGATLELSVPLVANGSIEIVQRGREVLHGRIVAPGRVEGRVALPVFEQTVIAAEPAIFKGAAALEPDPEHSRFVLARIPDGSSCASLVVDGEPAPGIVTAGAKGE